MPDQYPGLEKTGLLGGAIKNTLQVTHARELAKEGMTMGMKKGGVIPKTGMYKMHKDEDIVTADKSNLNEVLERAKDALGGPKRPKHGMRSTHVDHLQDGSHIVRHQPFDGEEVNYSAKNTKELNDKIKQYLGDAPEPEGAKEKNDSLAEEAKEKV